MAQFIEINLSGNLFYKPKRGGAFLLWLIASLLFASAVTRAEQLPIKTYTTADGLAQDFINRIVRDSRGFLWFCTGEGLSRFDGYEFTTYTTDQGLPHRSVMDLLETRDGRYWVATDGGGVCRFNPAGSPLFKVYKPGASVPASSVDVLAEDQSGLIWCGTHSGVCRLEESNGQAQFQFVEMGMPSDSGGNVVQALLADRQGSLWAGTAGSGLYRRWPDGRVEHYAIQQGLPDNRIEALLQDRAGRLWAATIKGLAQLVAEPGPNRSVVARLYTARDGLASSWTQALFESSDGRLWVGTDGGLSGSIAGVPGESVRAVQHFRSYTTLNGLSSYYVRALAGDLDANLWIGTDSGGAMKLARRGFTTYTEADGLAAPGVDAVVEDRAGELCMISSFTRHFINHFGGRRFTFVWPDFPKRISRFGWGYNQVTFQDHTGEWWVPTAQGLCRFPPVAHVEQLAHTPPRAVYTTRDGLPFDEVFRLFEDSRGDIWISTISEADNGLTLWERSTGTLHNFAQQEGLPPLKLHPADAFCESAAGNIWIGYLGWGLSRYANGRFTLFTAAEGVPEGTIRSLYLDHSGRLWIATSVGGLGRLDDPSAEHPRFKSYTTADGLSSNEVWCMTEDNLGHVYIGTGRGLDRLEPGTGYIKHYTSADGLVRGKVTSAFRDSHGVLWFASSVHGLARLVPEPDAAPAPPPILISGLHIAGVAYPLSQLGETEAPSLRLGPNQNQLSIEFLGLSFAPGEALRYQYRLEGADQDWSQPSDQRRVNYPNLSPGKYRFLVRAVNVEGIASTEPAIVAFIVLPPFWRQWWFLTIAAIVTVLAIYAAYRARVSRLVELERVRTRIATDLHDDIGANLSLIAMVSEVARSHMQREDLRMKEWFSTISTTSRDSVDAMSDIVWAVNPRRDHLSDLTQRMRRFAEDIFAARNIELRFSEPGSGRDLKVGADVRREVFLIFKESINNMVRHSRCTAANVEMEINRGWLVLQMADDGQGIDAARAGQGNGLASMRQRAAKLGGVLDVSSKGNGTSVTLRVRLGTWGRH
jgi:ligand-binding sensor domain-containing protein/two-component sensor histidine kinase